MLIRYLLMLSMITCLDHVLCVNDDKLRQALHTAPQGRADSNIVLEAWSKIRDDLDINLDYLTSGFASRLESVLSECNVSSKCHQGMVYLFDQAKLKETWALKTLDSWGKFPPPAMFSGTLTSFGSYDQCLEVDTDNDYKTQYCSIIFRPLLPKRPRFHNILDKLKIFDNSTSNRQNAIDYMKSKAHFFYYTQFRLGICLTSHCNLDEISRVTRIVGEQMVLQGKVAQCESRPIDQYKLTLHQTIALSIIVAIILVTLAASLAEFYTKPVRTFSRDLLHSFSVKRNFNSLFSLENINTELKCLNGIRFLTMSWIILGHTSVWIHYHAFSHSFNIIDVVKPFSSQALFNVTLSVDTFFLISGLLTSYATWKTTDGVYKKFNTLWFIVSRYARLTPCLAIAMCLTLFLPFMGSGPIWHEFIDPIAKRCEKNWWINLVYMQAFIKSEEICLLPTWWLSNDMLFHVISLLILIPLMRKAKFGVAINVFLIAIFTALAAVKSYQNDYLPAILATHPQVEEYWLDFVVQYFWKPYLHGPSFFIGLHLGYLLARKKYPKMTKVTSTVGWMVSLVMMFVVLNATYPLTLGEIWPAWANVLFDCTNRMVWSLALSWIIYASASGHGGLIGRFLGLPVFGPLAKITYAVYLTHMLLIWTYMGSRRELSYTSAYTGIYMFISHWTLAQVLGVCMALFVESPFLNIQKLMVKKFDGREGNTIKLGFLNKEEERKEESEQLTPF